MRHVSAILSITAAVAALLGTNATALATSKLPLVNASDCFSSASPNDEVASLVPGGAPSQAITLRCGDPTQGIIHIDSSHPIAEDGSDDPWVNLCFQHIFSKNYYEIPAAPGNVALQYRRNDGETATIVYLKDNGNVVTMYTSDRPSGNNWYACATG